MYIYTQPYNHTHIYTNTHSRKRAPIVSHRPLNSKTHITQYYQFTHKNSLPLTSLSLSPLTSLSLSTPPSPVPPPGKTTTKPLKYHPFFIFLFPTLMLPLLTDRSVKRGKMNCRILWEDKSAHMACVCVCVCVSARGWGGSFVSVCIVCERHKNSYFTRFLFLWLWHPGFRIKCGCWSRKRFRRQTIGSMYFTTPCYYCNAKC